MTQSACSTIKICSTEKPVLKAKKNPCQSSSCSAKSYAHGCLPHCGLGKSKDYCKAVCVVCNRKKHNANAIYTEQLKSGYMGHVPMANFQLGLSFPEAGIVGLAQFEAARNTENKCKEKKNVSANNWTENVLVNGNNNSGSSSASESLFNNGMANFNFNRRHYNGLKCWRKNIINIPETCGMTVDTTNQEDGVRCVICPCPVPVPMPDRDSGPPTCCPGSGIRCKTDPSKSGTPVTYMGPCLKSRDGFYIPVPYSALGNDCCSNNSNSNFPIANEEQDLKAEKIDVVRKDLKEEINSTKNNGTSEEAKSKVNYNNNEGQDIPIRISAFPTPSPCCKYPCDDSPCPNLSCYSVRQCTRVPFKHQPTMKNYECCPTPPPRPMYMYFANKDEEMKCESEGMTCPPNCCFVPCGMTKECCSPCCMPSCCQCPPSCPTPSPCCPSPCCPSPCCPSPCCSPCSPCPCSPCSPCPCSPCPCSPCPCSPCPCSPCCSPCPCSPCGSPCPCSPGSCSCPDSCSCNNNIVSSSSKNLSNNADYFEEEEKTKCNCDIHTCVPTPAFVPDKIVCECPCMPDRPSKLILTRTPAVSPISCCTCCKPANPFNAALYPRLANKAIQNWANMKQRTVCFELSANRDTVLPEDPNKCVDATLKR